MAGKVAEVNDALNTQPEKVNEDCYGGGWICKLQITDETALDDLMDAGRYKAYLETL